MAELYVAIGKLRKGQQLSLKEPWGSPGPDGSKEQSRVESICKSWSSGQTWRPQKMENRLGESRYNFLQVFSILKPVLQLGVQDICITVPVGFRDLAAQWRPNKLKLRNFSAGCFKQQCGLEKTPLPGVNRKKTTPYSEPQWPSAGCVTMGKSLSAWFPSFLQWG